MAISYITNALGATNSTTSFSITLPTTQAGDLLILEFAHRGTGDGTIGGTSVTTGGLTWSLKHSQLFGASAFSGKTYWTRATGDHSGQTVTGSGLTNSCAAIVTQYRGALASGDPLADATIVGEENASGNETQAEITTATDGAWVVLVVVNSPDYAISSQACTSPGTLTERAERLSTGGTDTSIAHASAEKASAGATGAFTWAQTNAASGSWAYAITPLALSTFAYAGSGGATVAGAAATSYTEATSETYSFTASGGMTAAGAATTSPAYSYPFTASGGLVAGGLGLTSIDRGGGYGGLLAPLALNLTPVNAEANPSTGEVTLSGYTASLAFAYTYAVSGGILSSNSADVSKTKAFLGSGGATLAGAGATQPAYQYPYLASGGAVLAGDALTAYVSSGPTTYTYSATGVVVSGGSGTTSYQNAGINVYVYPGGYFDQYFGEYFHFFRRLSIGGSAVISFQNDRRAYSGIYSGVARKDKDRAKQWLEKLAARVFKYIGGGRIKVGGEGYARFVSAPEAIKITPFKIGEGVKRPILKLTKPRKLNKVSPDIALVKARKAEALRLAKRKVEEEVLLMALI